MTEEQKWMRQWMKQRDGLWYFYDPDSNEFGPYATQEECEAKLCEYAKLNPSIPQVRR